MDTEPPGEDDPRLSRRRLLHAAAAAATAGIAGCSSGDGGTATPTATSTASPTPTPIDTPELPNIEKRVVQRDKAAITHVYATVTGEITWPASTVVSPTTIMGVWENSTGRLTIESDGVFTLESDATYQGTYRQDVTDLDLNPNSGDTVTYQYRRLETDSGVFLELYRNGELNARYQKTGQVEGFDTVVDAIQAMEILPAQGEEAGTQGDTYQSGGSGSGFMVTPDGYIVTNAHVVLADQDPNVMLFRVLAGETSSSLQQSVAEEFSDSGLTDAELQEINQVLYDKLIEYYLANGSIDNVSESLNVLNGRATPEDDLEVESWPATVEKEGTVVTEVDGEQTWSEDVAVISVDQDNLPSVDLGSAEDLSTGDEVFVIGYPNIGINEMFEDRSIALEPTLTTGVVSARRQLTSGINSIQTDAAINNGNSGGPIFDSSGQVVGIATFGPTNYDIEQVGFGLPIEVAKSFLDDLGIEPRSGEMDTAFDEGIQAYWRGNCDTATEKMNTVLDLYPDHPYAQTYIDNCESGDAPGSN